MVKARKDKKRVGFGGNSDDDGAWSSVKSVQPELAVELRSLSHVEFGLFRVRTSVMSSNAHDIFSDTGRGTDVFPN